ncbi:MAG: L-fucose isomerase [Bacilli bacterium]|nr:L-fucose isomerase [Bacilli bacterium]
MKMKIGIRPIIDGRRKGIRESLEGLTMAMAEKAKALIEKNCFYLDGTPVQCVIADTTIGGNKESALCREKFSKENVIATLSVTSCWCYGTETMDTDPLDLKAVWGLNSPSRPGAVYLAAVMAAHAQLGLPAFAIYGKDVQKPEEEIPSDVAEQIIIFCQMAAGIGEMRGRAYVNIGGVAMGIMGSYCDISFFKDYLGMRTEFVDMSEVKRRLELGIFDNNEFKKALIYVKENLKEGFDKNCKPKSREEKDADWETVVKMTLIVRDLIIGNTKLAKDGWIEESNGHDGLLGGFQGQRQWTDFMPNGDFTEAILNSCFDWNGIRAPLTLATENDTLNGISMLFGRMATGGAALFADVRSFWNEESIEKFTGVKVQGMAKQGVIHLINSGSACLDAIGCCKDKDGMPIMRRWWETTKDDVSLYLKKTVWCPADLDYFRGGGYSSRFETEAEMPITMIRINIVKGIGPTMQLAEGYTVKLPTKAADEIWKITDYTWPSTFVTPILKDKYGFRSVHQFMSCWGANHTAMVYGHVGRELIALACMLRIPVVLHNVDADQIFAPRSFLSFGQAGSDDSYFNACRAYGPLYK